MYFLSIVPLSAKIVAVDGKMTCLIGYFSNCCLFFSGVTLDLEPIFKNLSKSHFFMLFFLLKKERPYRYTYIQLKLGENTNDC